MKDVYEERDDAERERDRAIEQRDAALAQVEVLREHSRALVDACESPPTGGEDAEYAYSMALGELKGLLSSHPAPANLSCPKCNGRHVDRGEWVSRPHHKHLCEHCGHVWRVEPYQYGVEEKP